MIERQPSVTQLGAAAEAAAPAWRTEERVLHLVLALEDSSALWVLRRWLEEKPHLLPEPSPAPEPACPPEAAGEDLGRPAGHGASGGAAAAEEVRIPAPEQSAEPLSPSESDAADGPEGDREEEPAPEPAEVSHISAEEAAEAGPEMPRADFAGKLHIRSWRTGSTQGWHELHLEADGCCRWLAFRIMECPPHCRFDEECIKQGTWKVCGRCHDDAKAVVVWEDGSACAEPLAGRLAGPDQKWSPSGGWL